MAEYTRADVYLWEREWGAFLSPSRMGSRYSNNDPTFSAGRIEISPLNLPTTDVAPRAFPELARSSAFEGLPGVVADSLPDRALVRP